MRRKGKKHPDYQQSIPFTCFFISFYHRKDDDDRAPIEEEQINPSILGDMRVYSTWPYSFFPI